MAIVVLFASVREAAGTSSATVLGATLREVLDAAAERFGPEFARQVQHCRVMVDGERVSDGDMPVRADAEVAILPPVAGGAHRASAISV